MNKHELASTAEALVASGKGILAADESTSTMTRRLESVGVTSNEENRRAWRNLMFTASGIGEYLSGVILYDETIRQKADDGRTLVEALKSEGVIPGIKVDKSTKPLPNAEGEVVTEGLDGLRDRLKEYAGLGARFTKWRAVITIGEDIPSYYCVKANAHALGRFATLSQEAGLVPIVEPEVLMDGSHSIDRCFDVTEWTLQTLYQELYEQRVYLEGSLLKPNMVLSGKDGASRAGAEEVAEKTIRCFQRTVPAAVPGIVFLSGGQSDEEATQNLNAINRLAESAKTPWELSFSYGRGLQATPLKIWSGDNSKLPEAQRAFVQRSRVTAAARKGEYSPEMEQEAGVA